MSAQLAMKFVATWALASIAVIVFDSLRYQPVNWQLIAGLGAGFGVAFAFDARSK